MCLLVYSFILLYMNLGRMHSDRYSIRCSNFRDFVLVTVATTDIVHFGSEIDEINEGNHHTHVILFIY